MQASMSCKGNWYGNAPMESFWGSLKNEWFITKGSLHGRNQRSRSTSGSSTIASGAIRALAMYRQPHWLRISTRRDRLLETDVSFIDSTPQYASACIQRSMAVAFFKQFIAVCYCRKIDMQIGRTDVKKSAQYLGQADLR